MVAGGPSPSPNSAATTVFLWPTPWASPAARPLPLLAYPTCSATWTPSPSRPPWHAGSRPAPRRPFSRRTAGATAKEPLSIDGKTLRGCRDGEGPGQHLVAAYAPLVEAVLLQVRVDAKTNEHKAALELLGILPVKGRIVIGDSIFASVTSARRSSIREATTSS